VCYKKYKLTVSQLEKSSCEWVVGRCKSSFRKSINKKEGSVVKGLIH